jgi:hypothetical protein
MNSTPTSALENASVVLMAVPPMDLSDQIRSRDLDQMALTEHTQSGENRVVEARHRGLAGAGRPGEYQVPSHRRCRQPELLAPLGHSVQIDQGRDFCLHLSQAHEVV